MFDQGALDIHYGRLRRIWDLMSELCCVKSLFIQGVCSHENHVEMNILVFLSTYSPAYYGNFVYAND